jgi:hypothetical protein
MEGDNFVMATAAFNTWVNRGRDWSLAPVCTALVNVARSKGAAILGTIGNDDHLRSSNPQDHAPFSFTPWPVPLPGYVVTAVDIKEGAFADQFLQETREGQHIWVKYINLRGKHYDFRNRAWNNPSVSSSGDIHLHVSVRTDRLNETYNSREEEDMATAAEIANALLETPAFQDLIFRVQSLHKGELKSGGYTKNEENDVLKRLDRIEKALSEGGTK